MLLRRDVCVLFMLVERVGMSPLLGRAVLRSLQPILQADASLKSVRALHDNLGLVARSVKPDLSLYTFGSCCVFGVSEPKSDVDFVLLNKEDLANGRAADPATQLAKAAQSNTLSKFAAALRQKHRVYVVDEVRRARVPVVRVKGPGGINFDVTAHRRCGVRNSALLRAYFDQYELGRWLAFAVKAWSKRTHMNLSASGFLTSYGFNILVIYFLLVRQRVQFVPIHSMDCATLPMLPVGSPLVPPDEVEFGALLEDFCRYYAKEFDYDKEVITLSRAPGTSTRDMLGWTKEAEDRLAERGSEGERVSYRCCIEDPYEANLNVGRLITPFKLELLREQMERAPKAMFAIPGAGVPG